MENEMEQTPAEEKPLTKKAKIWVTVVMGAGLAIMTGCVGFILWKLLGVLK